MIEIFQQGNRPTKISQDLEAIEKLALSLRELGRSIDPSISETFDHLVELAGTRAFMPKFSEIQQYINRVSWLRKGIFDLGYIVPWTHVYGCLPYVGEGTNLGDVAAQVLVGSGQAEFVSRYRLVRNHGPQQQLISQEMSKIAENLYGNGLYPALVDSSEISKISAHKKYETRYYYPPRCPSTPIGRHRPKTAKLSKPKANILKTELKMAADEAMGIMPGLDMPPISPSPTIKKAKRVIKKVNKARADPFSKNKVIYQIIDLGYQFESVPHAPPAE